MNRLHLLLLLAIASGCAVTTVPVVIQKIAPPEIDTGNIERIAILPALNKDEHEVLYASLRSAITEVIKKTARYELRDLPHSAKPESPAEIVETAKAADVDILIEIRVSSTTSTRDGNAMEVAYSLYSAQTGERLLSKTEKISAADDSGTAKDIAEGIARILMPHLVEKTFFLEYGQNRLTRVGVELARKGIWEKAERKWWTAARAYNNDPAAYHNLGVSFERRGLYNLAKTAYENAFARNPTSILYSEDIDRIQSLLGRNQ